MRKIASAAAALILAGASLPAGAWWANPFGWFSNWFGDAGLNFNFSFSMHGGGWGRSVGGYGPWGYYPYSAPYWGPTPVPYAYPYAAAAQAAPWDQPRLAAPQTVQQAVESQRVLVEGMARPPAPAASPSQGPTEPAADAGHPAPASGQAAI